MSLCCDAIASWWFYKADSGKTGGRYVCTECKEDCEIDREPEIDSEGNRIEVQP